MAWWPLLTTRSLILHSSPPAIRIGNGTEMCREPMISLAEGPDPRQVAGRPQEIQPLTRAQERFARKNHASPGWRSLADERKVFFYREGPNGGRRWLVDSDGRVVQLDSFEKGSVGAAARTSCSSNPGLSSLPLRAISRSASP